MTCFWPVPMWWKPAAASFLLEICKAHGPQHESLARKPLLCSWSPAPIPNDLSFRVCVFSWSHEPESTGERTSKSLCSARPPGDVGRPRPPRDWSAVLLLDHRSARPCIHEQISRWLRGVTCTRMTRRMPGMTPDMSKVVGDLLVRHLLLLVRHLLRTKRCTCS